MKITLTKKVEVTTEFNPELVKVFGSYSPTVRQERLTVCYDGIEIATGHINYASNMVHLNMNTLNTNVGEVHDYIEELLVEGIESRLFRIQ